MKKRILSIVLTLCMVLMLVPATVFAEGGTYISPEMQELKDLISEAISKNNNELVLEKDYTITAAISFEEANGPFTLDLNGHVIRMEEQYAYNHQLISSQTATLILNDSRPDAQHTGEYAGLPAGGVITGSRADGTVPGQHAEGGGICIKKLIMNGGTIYDCRGSAGGGVSARIFEMNGGAISNCHAKDDGGAVFIKIDGRFTMNGGTIENCSCSNPESNSIFLDQGATMMVAGDRTINGTVFSNGNIKKSTEADNNLIFNDAVYNKGTIEYGTYYGGIVDMGGTVSNPYYTVSFDLNGGSGSIPKQWFVNIDTAQALEPVAPTREGYEFAGWYNGDTKYDFAQNVTEDITLTAKWENPEAPVITGLEDGKTYCDTVQFEVSDNVGVASVTANGVTLTPDANNKYTLEKGIGAVTVVAIDKANSQTSVTVTVNDGHTWNNGVCSVCGYTCIHKDDSPKDHECDICGKTISDHTPGEWEYNSTQHWRFCAVCPAEIDRADDHTFIGNTCTVCGYTRPSGGGVSTYAITVENAKNGTVTVAPKTASKGTTVTLTVEPDKGYTLETLTVTGKSGNEIELTSKGDGKYTFTMPASKVTVTATFMEDNSMLNFFVDVFPGDYYYDAVLWAAENGITGGVDDTHFAPNAPCTRAQIVTFLWRAAGSPVVNYAMNFSDVPADAYYAEAVRWAVSQGITKGTSDTTFGPDATCTRAQAMTFIYRSEQAQGGGMQGTWMFLNPFSDVDLENYYGEAVMWAVANGVTNGTSDTTFSPGADCTRAQIVTFLHRFFVK